MRHGMPGLTRLVGKARTLKIGRLDRLVQHRWPRQDADHGRRRDASLQLCGADNLSAVCPAREQRPARRSSSGGAGIGLGLLDVEGIVQG